MKFSIICPSYLGPYKTAAMNRPAKLLRALKSCVMQHYKNFEVIVVADGCEKTFEIVDNLGSEFDGCSIRCELITKQPMFSGSVRNRGIHSASGEYIAYLDIDDYFGVHHLQKIWEGIHRHSEKAWNNGKHIYGKKPDWVWFNDYIFRKQEFRERKCSITQRYHYGTSNICHRKDLNVYWQETGYAKDDQSFIRSLQMTSMSYFKIETPQYMVCHIPTLYDI